MPIEATFAQPQDPLTELGEALNREKSIAQSVKADTESATTLIALEESYPEGGLRAWLVVLGCFLYACTVFGWGLNWGVLQDYYHTTMFPNTSLSVLGTIVGLANFVSMIITMNGSSYVFGGLGDRFGYKKMIAISCFLAYLCLLASAFVTKVYQLFLFQGCLLGLSQGIGMPLYFSLCSQWFLKKRGLATGIAVSGSGIGGGIETLIMRQLISRIGYRNTILAFSSSHAVIWIFAWFLLKERLPPGTNPTAKKLWLPKKITGSFWSVALSMFFGLTISQPPYYLSTTYTRQMVPGLSTSSLLATVPLIVMNFCLGIGRITAGRLADIFGPINMFFCSFFVGGLLQMVFWTFARTYTAIIVFSILNGLVGSWFMSLLPVVCARLFGVEGLSTITGFMILANSPGQFVGTTIAASVLSTSGNNWKAVSLYSGSMQVIGALSILYARFHQERRVFVKV
ncbi:major facilitator superfamily domain-containing protein [Lentinula boryana]|uniref:Major facilitator superfamily domain-containing protein n=1 Tax=Lentinula boryana TaxID=40481 RepID=A0ABQ8Q2U8_9AGAR|nr:major facilitator superfamily domain-containing protein [Lentinula boryana]